MFQRTKSRTHAQASIGEDDVLLRDPQRCAGSLRCRRLASVVLQVGKCCGGEDVEPRRVVVFPVSFSTSGSDMVEHTWGLAALPLPCWGYARDDLSAHRAAGISRSPHRRRIPKGSGGRVRSGVRAVQVR
ncbi:hypothetical protein ACP70R_016315 [Stipagrostis hirtigluma subsp. patula]